ncbi:hypothetical protein DENSPDRAFT_642361 [Dentipellis sp. KUC8613]|nr:hypothetical protein DENSPDRAFT_642361 [Dentipellis sp. KUC8613]
MRARLPFSISSCRSYSTRLPQKPRMRIKDPLANAPSATVTALPEDLTFIHRPPPSLESPVSYTTNPTSPLLRKAHPSGDAPLPPHLHKVAPKKPSISEEALAEMRRLRASDPTAYTRKRLAEQFDCTVAFVGRMAPLSKQAKRDALERREVEHEDARSRWGEKKAIVREIRKKRREFW